MALKTTLNQENDLLTKLCEENGIEIIIPNSDKQEKKEEEKKEDKNRKKRR